MEPALQLLIPFHSFFLRENFLLIQQKKLFSSFLFLVSSFSNRCHEICLRYNKCWHQNDSFPACNSMEWKFKQFTGKTRFVLNKQKKARWMFCILTFFIFFAAFFIISKVSFYSLHQTWGITITLCVQKKAFLTDFFFEFDISEFPWVVNFCCCTIFLSFWFGL